MSVEVRWIIAREDGEFPDGPDQTTILAGEWADCRDNAEGAVKDICEDHFSSEIWGEWFGMDETAVVIQMRILAPPSISGDYEAQLGRRTFATASRIKP